MQQIEEKIAHLVRNVDELSDIVAAQQIRLHRGEFGQQFGLIEATQGFINGVHGNGYE
mgnify:CR=1 FL=1